VGADAYGAVTYVDPLTGETFEDGEFFGTQFALSGEVGLLPVWPLQITFRLPVFFGLFVLEVPELDEPVRATTVQPGDASVGIQVGLVRRPLVLAFGAEAKIPLYSISSIGQRFGAWQEAFPVPGEGQVDVTLWLRGGGRPAGGALIIEAALGYRFRTEHFVGDSPDLVLVDGVPFELGLTADLKRAFVGFRLEGNVNVREDDRTRQRLAIGAVGSGVLGRGFSLEGYVLGEVWAQNAAQGIAFGLGLSWQGLLPPPGGAKP